MLTTRLRFADVRNTTTFRLTVMLGLVFALGVTVLLGLIYGLSARELTKRSDQILRVEAAQLAALPESSLPGRIRSEIARSPAGLNYFELRSAAGEHVIGNLRIHSDIALDHPEDVPLGQAAARPIRLLAVRLRSGEVLLVGRDISPMVDLRQRVLIILVWSGVAIAAAVLIGAFLLSLAPLRRVRDLQSISRTIAAGDLGARMPLLGRGDELDLLAGTVNAMVDEMERVIAQVKGVTDAVAHDLRTPLTRVRGQLYRIGQSPDSTPEIAAMLKASTQDLDMVLERFAALLRISELEAARRYAGFGMLGLAPLLRGIGELYEPLAEERTITFTVAVDEEREIRGDEKLLFEAISNLVDNAIKFAPAGGEVSLRIGQRDGTPLIEVQDDGPGIDEEERRAVLRRFHRGAGTGEVPGSGLGLSVVSAILHLHGFALEFEDAAPGLIARIVCGGPRAVP